MDSEGYGLLQFSSSNLKGRKLFSWGHRKGSSHWQKMLTDKAGDYVEIQAGLGKTQYECIPMPPKCVWSFSECYTLADIPESKVNLPYNELVNAVREQIHSLGGCSALDEKLPDFPNDISLQKGDVVLSGSGFGYLNKTLGGKAPEHLAFYADDEVKPWIDLAENKTLMGRLSFAYGCKMENLLMKNRNICNWNIAYQLALLAYDRREFEKAKQYCAQSLIFDNNEYNNHLYGFILYQLDDERSVYFAEKCIDINSGSYCLAESVFALLLKQKAYSSVIGCFDKLSEDIKQNPRILMYLSMAYLKAGDAKKAEEILTGNGGLVLLDFREGDKFLDILYRSIRKTVYGENYNEVIVPEQFDFIVSDIKTEKTE